MIYYLTDILNIGEWSERNSEIFVGTEYIAQLLIFHAIHNILYMTKHKDRVQYMKSKDLPMKFS